MYGQTFVQESILIHDTNDGSFIRMDDSSNSTNVNIGTAMIIYALNVNSTVGLDDNTNVVSSDAAVSTSVYEGRGYTVVFFVVTHIIFYTCRVYGTLRVLGHNSTYVSW
jgi:hypothetical protein